jgi:hypothetical protein
MDSTAIAAAADSAATDAVASDSLAAGTLASDSLTTPSAADSAAADTARAPTLARQAPPDSVRSASSQKRIWTIVLATRESQSAASNLRRVYQARFQSEGLSVRVREVQSDNATQYQIMAGEFPNEPDATATMQRLRMQMPGSARVERIQ